MKKRLVIKSSKNADSKSKQYVKAAEDDDEDLFGDDIDNEEADGIMDAIDDVADNVEDLQDQIDDVDEDEVDISMNNNIASHYIAECDRCGGVFISAVVKSDQQIDHVSGICPLCGRETEQALKWVIEAV